MLKLISLIKERKERVSEHPKEIKCSCCGEIAIGIPGEKTNIYFCKQCNKLIYYVDPALLDTKVKPFSLGWLKKKS
jgi:hypothetical protein